MVLSRIHKRTWEIIGPTPPGDKVSRGFDIFMTTLIAVNVLAVILETVPAVRARWGPELDWFELVSIIAFSIEYVLSVWACTADARFREPLRGRIRYIFSMMALFDLIAIVPFFITFLPLDLRFMRALRLTRTLRLLKAARYMRALRVVGRVVRKEKEPMLATPGIMFVLLVMTASLLYFAENGAQPGLFGSIPKAMWWGISALVKVPLGAGYPVTLAGRVLGSILALMGVALFALPAGILGSAFLDDLRRRKTKKAAGHVVCPHCGKAVEQPTSPSV